MRLSTPLTILALPATILTQTCAPSYTLFSTFCCSGTLLSSPTGSHPTSGPTISVPTGSGATVTPATETLPPAPTVTGVISSVLSSFPSGLPIPTLTPITTELLTLPGPHHCTTALPTDTQGSPPVQVSGREWLAELGDLDFGLGKRQQLSGSPATPMSAAPSMTGSVLAPGVTCFGAVSMAGGSKTGSATGVTSFASGSGTGTGGGMGSGSTGASATDSGSGATATGASGSMGAGGSASASGSPSTAGAAAPLGTNVAAMLGGIGAAVGIGLF